MDTNIYNLIIMDESGSMESIKSQIISGYNETVQTIFRAKETYPGQNHLVSLVFFNESNIRILHDCAPVETLKELKNSDYNPNSLTPLYDAMGFSLTKLKEKVNAEDKVLVTILTDGLENASKEYSMEAIKKLVEELKNTGWVFAYIGANQDVEKVAFSLSIDHHYQFQSSEKGTNVAFNDLNESQLRAYLRIHREVKNFGENFFKKETGDINEEEQEKSSDDGKQNKKKTFGWIFKS